MVVFVPRVDSRESGGPLVFALHDDGATSPFLAGAKAANLARAMAAGLPVIDGFVISTRLPQASRSDLTSCQELLAAWRRVSQDGSRSLVVRSSSVGEDVEASSMAGMFTSVLDVRGWDSFIDAVRAVQESALATPLVAEAHPMAVLVQPHIDALVGGILFGLDPVSGRRDRLVVVASEGPPEGLVAGRISGTRYQLTRTGRRVAVAGGDQRLSWRRRRALAALARRAHETFNGPQDIEWAIDRTGRLWLLQSRPVTAVASEPANLGPLLGPGPIAETFPDPLTLLEQDLWIHPLRQGLVNAVQVVGTIPKKRIRESDLITVIEGRAAVDLELLGVTPARKSLVARLDPRPPVRRLLASWRVGRLRACLPLLAEDLRAQVDRELEGVPGLRTVADRDLVTLLHRAKAMLTCLHGQEILAGMLMTNLDRGPTAATVGLTALANARSEGLADSAVSCLYPETLVLYPPRIGAPPPLPEVATAPEPMPNPTPLAEARENLRISARVVQELTVRVALELGRRGVRRTLIHNAVDVRWMTTTELEAVVVEGAPTPDLYIRSSAPVAPPLPAVFQVAADGTIFEPAIDRDGEGIGAGGGRGMGRVIKVPAKATHGDVLVVRNLDPRLASSLPHIAGLVAETGSVLSHLAILAREFNVPTVVSVPGACDKLPEGVTVVVDGSIGEVRILQSSEDR